MSTVTYRDVRSWGIDNGYKCRTGKLGQNVVVAYAAAHPDDVIADLPIPVAAVEEIEDDEPSFLVTVDIPGDPDAGTAIAVYLLEAVYAAYESGRRAERSRMIQQLGGAA